MALSSYAALEANEGHLVTGNIRLFDKQPDTGETRLGKHETPEDLKKGV